MNQIWEPNAIDLATQRERISQQIKLTDAAYSACVFLFGVLSLAILIRIL